MNKSKRMIYRLDPVNKPFYTYCLFYSKDKNDVTFTENSVFYVGKGKNVKILANRREREHIRESYQEEYFDFHKSRKIRLLESEGYFIMSKVLEEFNDEDSSYASEEKWENYFLANGNDLTNMIKCGIKSVGSGENHPSFSLELRKDSSEIIRLYNEEFWPIQKICRHYNLSQKTVKKILFEESNNKQRDKNLRSDIWKFKNQIILSYQVGIPSYKLAKEYKCSINTILSLLRQNNIEIRGKHPQLKSSKDWDQKEEIVNEYLSGKSIDYFSKKYKCDKVSTIDPILKEAGIEKRSSKSEIWNNKEEILGLIENNWTYKQISQKYRVSIPLISKIINYDTRTLLLA